MTMLPWREPIAMPAVCPVCSPERISRRAAAGDRAGSSAASGCSRAATFAALMPASLLFVAMIIQRTNALSRPDGARVPAAIEYGGIDLTYGVDKVAETLGRSAEHTSELQSLMRIS